MEICTYGTYTDLNGTQHVIAKDRHDMKMHLDLLAQKMAANAKMSREERAMYTRLTNFFYGLTSLKREPTLQGGMVG